MLIVRTHHTHVNCPNFPSLAVINTQKPPGEEVYLALMFWVTVDHTGKSGQELKQAV